MKVDYDDNRIYIHVGPDESIDRAYLEKFADSRVLVVQDTFGNFIGIEIKPKDGA